MQLNAAHGGSVPADEHATEQRRSEKRVALALAQELAAAKLVASLLVNVTRSRMLHMVAPYQLTSIEVASEHCSQRMSTARLASA